MTTLILAPSDFVARKTPGEERLAERIEPTTDDTLLNVSQRVGHAWREMAVLCADWQTIDLCANALHQRKLPFNVRKRTGEYNPSAEASWPLERVATQLHDPSGMFAPTAPAARAEPQSLYPQGFSAGRLIEALETQAVWDGV